MKSANLYVKLFDGDSLIKIPMIDYYFDQKSSEKYINSFPINVLFTPGHTPGSVCFHIDEHLFTGDTLLKGKIGRVDLPGGHKKNLLKSLRIISKLPQQTVIYPGHGDSSTIGDELSNNKSLFEILEWV